MFTRALIIFLLVLAGCGNAPTVEPPDTSIILLPDVTAPPPTGMYIAELAGSNQNHGNTWVAYAEVTVVDDTGAPVPGVLVSGEWSEGEQETVACTTDADGICELQSDSIRKRVGSATIEILKVEHESLDYAPELDEDFDRDGGPTATSVQKP